MTKNLENKQNRQEQSASPKMERFSVSIEPFLMEEFDKKIQENGAYKNRSEAIRGLIRAYLVEEEWKANEEVVGAIVSLYNHHDTEVLTEIQHDYHTNVLSTMHVHLDENTCVEVTFIRGRAEEIQKIADRLKNAAKHVELAMTSTGKKF